MSPARDLYRRKAQARQPHRHREHPDLRIDEHVRRPFGDRPHPLAQAARALFEVCCMRAGEFGFPVVVEPEVERLEGEARRVQLLEPALDDRAPHRVVSEVRRDDTHTERTSPAAPSWRQRQALPTRPFRHDARAQPPVLLEQMPVAVLLVRKVERLMHPHRAGAAGEALVVEPALQPVQLARERLPMLLRSRVAFAYAGQLCHGEGPACFGEFGLYPEHVAKACDGFLLAVGVRERDSQVVADPCHARVQGDRLPVARNGLLQPLLLGEHVAQIGEGRPEIGAESERSTTRGRRLVEPADLSEEVPENRVALRRGWVYADRLAAGLDRLARPANSTEQLR